MSRSAVGPLGAPRQPGFLPPRGVPRTAAQEKAGGAPSPAAERTAVGLPVVPPQRDAAVALHRAPANQGGKAVTRLSPEASDDETWLSFLPTSWLVVHCDPAGPAGHSSPGQTDQPHPQQTCSFTVPGSTGHLGGPSGLGMGKVCLRQVFVPATTSAGPTEQAQGARGNDSRGRPRRRPQVRLMGQGSGSDSGLCGQQCGREDMAAPHTQCP